MDQSGRHNARPPGNGSAGGSTDAMAIISIFGLGTLGVIVVVVLLANMLSEMPTEFTAALLLSLFVVGVAFAAAFLRREKVKPRIGQPPVLVFRRPTRRRKR